MKTKKTIFKFLILLVVLILICWGYREYYELKKWGEHNSLVKSWPRLQKEKIKSISFCRAFNPDTGKSDVIFEVPKENLQEFIKILDEKMKKVKPVPAWHYAIVCCETGNMAIVTEKGKYIFNVHAHVGNNGGTRSHVHGRQWTSYELGEYLYKIGFPCPEYKYAIPSKEQTQAIVLFSHCYDPPLCAPVALFGDKVLADKLIYQGTKSEWENTAGGSLEPKKVFAGRHWLEKIMDAYEVAAKEAEERDKGKVRAYYPGDIHNFDGKILFITRHELHGKRIGINEDVVYHEGNQKGISISGNIVYDDYIKSELLKVYFDELGLTDELLAREPNKVLQN